MYRISTYTGVEAHAGTDANVYISIYGDENKAENRHLNSNKEVFRKGT